MKKKRLLLLLSALGAGTFALYLGASNILINALLVPSFMEKLDAFEQVTEQGLSEQVHTEDIMDHRSELRKETDVFLSAHPKTRLSITSYDGYRLEAEEFQQPAETHLYALLLHGYTAKKEDMELFACKYYEKGYSVLLPDLRCQGESEGNFIGMGATDSKDCLSWLDEILKQDPMARIAVHGQSMGAATALLLSCRKSLPKNVFAVVSDCAYESAELMAEEKIREWLHLLPHPIMDTAKLFLVLRRGYPLGIAAPIRFIKNSTVPTLFIHGTADRFVSVSHVFDLYNAARMPGKELFIVEGAGHAQAQEKDPAAYFKRVFDFLNKHLPA